MGFLSRYDEPRKLDLGDGFYVQYRACLTGKERDWLRAKFFKPEAVPGTTTTRLVTEDPFGNQTEATLLAIVEWNLTDDKDVLLPFEHDVDAEAKSGQPSPLRQSWDRLPDVVQDLIEVEVANASVEPSQEDNARFPERDGVGGEGGQVEPSDDSESVL
ncbi:MAG: hypothetical protein V4472_25505 [Pseudomonadota bacterium]